MLPLAPVRPLSWTLVGASGRPAPRLRPLWSRADLAMAVLTGPEGPWFVSHLSPSEEPQATCIQALRL